MVTEKSVASIEVAKNRNRNLINMYTDPIADYLTRVRNAIAAGHRVVEIPASNLKKEMTKILFDQGYVLSYQFNDASVQGTIKIALKYDKETKESVIRKLERISTPGLRKYVSASEMPRVLNGLGIAIVSTSKGVMTNKQARLDNVGGEVLCYVY
ncbi:30S ribosomal protein S8 [Polaribacter pacificus]|uniref:Small ribosomal subunit protein uS8 n=2 Tax=Polaribacter pacificus TaxID=1775173 RepID=A0A917HTR5_9FLAO|nr:30S ribosomal protein S8 [Polaribacter pacificus]